MAATRGMKGVGAMGAGVLAGKRAAQNTNSSTNTNTNSSSMNNTKVNKAKPKVNTNRTAAGAGSASGGSGGAGDAGGKGRLDVDLLREAFSYTDQLLQNNSHEEEQEALHAARQAGAAAGAGAGAGASGSNRGGGMQERNQYVDMGGGIGPNKKPHPRSAPTNRGSENLTTNNTNTIHSKVDFGFPTGGGGGGGGGARIGSSLSGNGNMHSAATKRVGSNLVKKLRTQAAAYGGSSGSKGQSQSRKQADLLERRAQGGFDTSLGASEKHSYSRTSVEDGGAAAAFSTAGAASGGYGGLGNPDSATGLAAKNKVDYEALIQNFESGKYICMGVWGCGMCM